jgi:branched-chain amino acid transport system permease protein
LQWPIWIGFPSRWVGIVFSLLTEFIAVRPVLKKIDQHLYVLSTLALALMV